MAGTTTRDTSNPPKLRSGATEEEFEAAVNGELKPRNPVLKAPEGSRPLGKTTGLPIQMAWAYTFQEEEKLPLEKRRTDAQITAFMLSEFPTMSKNTANSVANARRDYNKGGETRGVRPKRQSTGRPARETVTAPPDVEVKSTDEKGRVVLSKEFANRTVIVEHVSNTEILVRLARVIPEREAWLYENPEALASVREGLAQARNREFVPGPDLAADARWLKQLEHLED